MGRSVTVSLYLRALSLAKTSQKTPLELCIFSVYFIIALGGDDATRRWVGGCLLVQLLYNAIQSSPSRNRH